MPPSIEQNNDEPEDVQMKDVDSKPSPAGERTRRDSDQDESDAIRKQLLAEKNEERPDVPRSTPKDATKQTQSEERESKPKPNGESHPTHQPNKVLPSVEPSDRDIPSATAEIDANRLAKDMNRIKTTLDETSHKAGQNVLRERWRTLLFDPPDESHVAFILRAGLKNSTPGILHRVVKDDNVFKPQFIEAAANKTMLRKKVIETATPDEILRNISSETLDAVVAHTIETVSVKSLVSWLAKANRLGFEESDIQKGDTEIFQPTVLPQPRFQSPYAASPIPPPQPYVPPHAQSPAVATSHHQPTPSQRPLTQQDIDNALVEQNKQREIAKRQAIANHHAVANGPLVCPDCNQRMSTLPGFQHHINKKPCMRPVPPEGYRIMCGNCLQGFTTKQGHDYHFLKRVCLGDDDSIHTNAPAPPPGFMQAPPALPSNDGLPSTSNYVSPNPYGAPTMPPQAPWASQNGHPGLPSRTSSFTAANASPAAASPLVVEPVRRSPKPKKEKKQQHGVETVDFTNSSTPPTTRKQAPRAAGDVRIDPSQLPPERLDALNRELADVDARFEQGLADIPADWTEAEKETRRTALKNANSSRKSQIRKSYGVTLRMREKDKVFKAQRESLLAKDESSPVASANASPAPAAAPPPPRPAFDAVRNITTHSPLATPSISGFSPVNAPRAMPPSINGYGPYNPVAASVSTPTPASAHNSHTNGFTARNANPYPRLDMNVRQYLGPETKSKVPLPGEGKPMAMTMGSSGTTTPGGGSNVLKRRHEESEHEKRPGSGQGGYTGSIPTAPLSLTGTPKMGSATLPEGAAEERGRKTTPQRQVIDLSDDTKDVSDVVTLVNSASKKVGGSSKKKEKEKVEAQEESEDSDSGSVRSIAG